MSQKKVDIKKCGSPTCSRVGQLLPPHEFYKNKHTKDGLSSWCKECKSTSDHKYYLANQENIKTKQNHYYQENKTKVQAIQKKYREDNPDQLKLMRKQEYTKHRDRYMDTAHSHYLHNKEEHLRQGKQWAIDNPELSKSIGRDAHYRQYGICPEIKEQMLVDTDFQCSICSVSVDFTSAHIDHIHSPKYKTLPEAEKRIRIRGILCSFCNWGLGQFKDDVHLLNAAARYLASGLELELDIPYSRCRRVSMDPTLLLIFGNKCNICSTPFDPHSEDNQAKPHVDHGHHTNLVRGLLCSDCNKGLGKFRDNPRTLHRAITYLSRYLSFLENK